MDNINELKLAILTALGMAGAFISQLLGGWDAGMSTLIIFMAIDYFTGFLVGAVFHKSPKSENGSLDSKVGFKGLCKKGMILLIVLIAVRLDLMVNSDYIRDSVIIAFSLNELVSIIENAGLMGIKMPTVITKAIDSLKGKETGV